MSDDSAPSNRWLRLEHLFHAALERETGERAEFLRAAAGEDETLLLELEEMLAAHEAETGLAIERRLISDTEASSSILAPGTRVGPYEIVRLLGRGGMGEVYLSERADGEYEQRVALKLMRAGFENRSLAARFRQERQVLARLEHAGIARLIDGGLTSNGHPFLAMEHVEGKPITTYCDDGALPLEERLRLFQGVCHALHFAHQNLIVHRDLKPSNILVTARGEVKLLDFGIAKLLADEAVSPGLTLASGSANPLTPEFASPEQVRGELVSTSSDVYALGLLLYELVTGVRAQPVADTSPASIVESVCHREPARPSVAALEGEKARERARQRKESSPERLSRRLRGDLDTIVTTALRKDARLRYASAEALAEDLERYLTGLPVQARPGTFGYRAGKFLRRHRLGVAAAAIATLAIVSGLALALAGWTRAQRAEARAREEAEVARQAVDFLVNLFKVNDPEEGKGETVTARELLDQGAEAIGTTLEDQPSVRARLLNVMGRAYRGLGFFEPAERLLRQQVETLRALEEPKPADLARALTSLSALEGSKGDYAQSRDLAREAVAVLEAAGEPDPLVLADCLNQLALALSNLGELAEAREITERVLALREQALGPDHQVIAGTLNNLAILAWQQGNPRAALPWLERALGIYERTRGREHLTTANTLNNLALMHDELGELEDARMAHEQALAIRRKALAPDHPDIAESLNNLGKLLNDLERPAEARIALEEALEIRRKRLGPDHPITGTTLLNLGLSVARLGDLANGRALLQAALEIFTRKLGPEHVYVSYAFDALARIDLKAGDGAAAESSARRALEVRQKALGRDHPGTVDSRKLLGQVLRQLGRSAEAAALEAPPEATPEAN